MKSGIITILLLVFTLTISSFQTMVKLPEDEITKTQTGVASYYNDKHHGKKTASGEIYHKAKLTAAHRTLPFGTEVKVTNLTNGKSVTVRINDRGPYAKGRLIDLSKLAAQEIGLMKMGIAKVKLEYSLPQTASNG
jgi:rare lipoprotein A